MVVIISLLLQRNLHEEQFFNYCYFFLIKLQNHLKSSKRREWVFMASNLRFDKTKEIFGCFVNSLFVVLIPKCDTNFVFNRIIHRSYSVFLIHTYIHACMLAYIHTYNIGTAFKTELLFKN